MMDNTFRHCLLIVKCLRICARNTYLELMYMLDGAWHRWVRR